MRRLTLIAVAIVTTLTAPTPASAVQGNGIKLLPGDEVVDKCDVPGTANFGSHAGLRAELHTPTPPSFDLTRYRGEFTTIDGPDRWILDWAVLGQTMSEFETYQARMVYRTDNTRIRVLNTGPGIIFYEGPPCPSQAGQKTVVR